MEQCCEQQHCSVCGLIPLAPRLRGGTRIVAVSPSMQALLKRVARFADSEAPVAVLGETGTGKEVIARILHANCSRAKQPFVAVNVAALPAELLESELFGHGRGAFTGAGPARQGLFEAANGGTLFLDEIAEMPLSLQVKLLRVLQDGEVRRVGESSTFAVDVRIICATHRDPAEQVRQGQFREDLYYRLKVLTLRVPPLRSRKADILPLAYHFLKQEKPALLGFTPEVKTRFMDYAWPGNVRELQNVVKHGAALAIGDYVCEDDLPEEITSSPESLCDLHTPPPPGLRTLASVEREHILQVLDACQGSQARAASVLGIARNTLWRRLRSFA
jgi:two-component system response regulator HydG